MLTKNGMISEPWSDLWYISIISVSLFSPPWRWPHGWPKHVVGYHAIKLHPENQNAYVGLW